MRLSDLFSAQVLAIGFLLIILSCALFQQYLPLLVVATFVLAPLPNWICGRCANPDDFGAEGSGNAVLDFGKFCTGFLVVMGIGEFCLVSLDEARFDSRAICHLEWLARCGLKVVWMFANRSRATALPVVLAHSEIIRIPAMIMSIVGGLLIYGTIISFGMFFQEDQEF
jgi:hypothetical protein